MKSITQTKLWEMYIESAKDAFENGRQEVAENILLNALKELSEILETRKVLLIEAQHTLANIYRSEGRYFEAEPLYRWSLAMAEANFGKSDAELLPLLEDLATSYQMQGRSDDEKNVRDRIINIRQAGSSDNPPEKTIASLEAKPLDAVFRPSLLHGTLEGESIMKVLLAVADEEYGAAIADFVTHHNWPAGTSFRVLHIIEWTPPERELAVSQTLTQYLEDRHCYATKVTNEMAGQIRKAIPDSTVEEVIMEGSPVQRIIASASAWKAEMIVVGSHGRKGMSLFILGSVSLGVVSNATCSVVVIRSPATATNLTGSSKEEKQALPVA